ncbi:RCY1 Recyclin-1 [Candida maltosa Xu316]
MARVIWNSDIDVYNRDVMPLPIARNIAGFLPIDDLLSFSQVSRNTHEAVNNPKLWISKLKTMGVWDNSIQLTKEDIKKTQGTYLNSPLTCMDYVYRSGKNARFQVLKIYKCLHGYYNDLLINKSYNRLKIFKDFQTPEEQSKILQNLLNYNKVDYIEATSVIAHEKLVELFEIFENALLRELEIHFDIDDYEKTRQFIMILIELNNHQTLIDFFLQKSIFDENKEIFNLENFNSDKYYKGNVVNIDAIDGLVSDIAEVFNEQSHIIDLIFPESVPMMYKVSEELISNKLSELLTVLIESSKKYGLYFQVVPMMYQKLSIDFLDQLKDSKNGGESYRQLLQELLDMSFESFAAEYMREEVSSFKGVTKKKLVDWKETISKREQETTQKILDGVRSETKNDFLTSFKNVFTMNFTKSKEEEEDESDKYSKIQAKAKILSENIKSLDKIFSPELIVNILSDVKVSLHRLLKFKNFSIVSLRDDIYQSTQFIFIDVLDLIGMEHLNPGFEKALTYLQTYNPNSSTFTLTHNESFDEPLVLFFDLINMADIIIQMIDIFYKEEMLHNSLIKNENSILNPSLQNKKKLEALVDKYVADGLNIGIEILVYQIENIYRDYLKETDYNPPDEDITNFGATEAAQKAIKVLEKNMNLLVDSADKSIVDVFQQEIAERFFQIIVKLLKTQTISTTGATNLISDLNLYSDFISNNIKTNKRMVVPLYQALKKIGNIYLISGDDYKAIGKLVSDLSKFNGIFNQEEIYEFVQRRRDWLIIKRHVEKIMYGFGLGDCSIM